MRGGSWARSYGGKAALLGQDLTPQGDLPHIPVEDGTGGAGHPAARPVPSLQPPSSSETLLLPGLPQTLAWR